ncbi:MAG: PAC2 family protein [Actinomycetota bacterium]|jgi:predicted ATP-grasp superfamily ATP-dependent carboligase|nr:PAC2 family protein [Actinomycetota bacterium]
MSLAQITNWPELDHPVLVLGMEGWVDAGGAGSQAVSTLMETFPREVVATFDSDALIDHRSRRPIIRISHGIHGPLAWPELRLYAATETGGRSLLILAGPEPDLRWHEWSAEVVSIGQRLGVELVVGLGAFPAPVPHTRPVRLAASAGSEQLAGSIGFLPATIDVPAGAQAVLEVAFDQVGVPSVGIWARVPHYVSGTAYPEAAAVLLDKLAELSGLHIDTSLLHDAGRVTRDNIQTLIERSGEHRAMVRKLEAEHDSELGPAASPFTEVPTGDEIAAELEKFLRGEGHPEG